MKLQKQNPARHPAPKASRSATTSRQTQIIQETAAERALSSFNFKIIIGAGVLIIVGFALMLGGSSTPDTFNPDIFSTRRVVIGPLLAFLGFVVMGIGIIINPDRTKAKKVAPEARVAANDATTPQDDSTTKLL